MLHLSSYSRASFSDEATFNFHPVPSHLGRAPSYELLKQAMCYAYDSMTELLKLVRYEISAEN